MSIENLPPEVTQMISELLPQPDLSSFRSTCRRHAAIGARAAFREIHLMFRFKSFRNMLNVSQDPVLRKYVKSVLYHGFLLEELWSQEQWENHLIRFGDDESLANFIMNAPPQPSRDASPREWRLYNRTIIKMGQDRERDPRNKLTKQQLQDGYNAYREIIEEQGEIDDLYIDVDAITTAFSMFPNLKHLTMPTQNDYGFERFRETKALKDSFKPGLVGTGKITDSNPEDDAATGIRQLQALLVGVTKNNIKIESLTIDMVGWEVFLSEEVIFETSALCLTPKDFCSAFRWLKDLRLDLAPGYDLDGHEWPEVTENFGKALRGAEGLEILTLAFGCPSWPIIDRRFGQVPHWDFLAKNMTWKHLKTLSLAAVRITEDFLVDFMQRQSSTLTHLTLAGLDLEDGEWATAFQRMKPHVLHLKDLVLCGEFGMTNDEDPEDGVITLYMDPGTLWWMGLLTCDVDDVGDFISAYLLDPEDVECPMLTLAEGRRVRSTTPHVDLRKICSKDLFRKEALRKLQKRRRAWVAKMKGNEAVNKWMLPGWISS